MADQPTVPEPISPLTPLAAAAMSIHEAFMAYVGAGFTRAEALQLVAVVLAVRAQRDGNG